MEELLFTSTSYSPSFTWSPAIGTIQSSTTSSGATVSPSPAVCPSAADVSVPAVPAPPSAADVSISDTFSSPRDSVCTDTVPSAVVSVVSLPPQPFNWAAVNSANNTKAAFFLVFLMINLLMLQNLSVYTLTYDTRKDCQTTPLRQSFLVTVHTLHKQPVLLFYSA